VGIIPEGTKITGLAAGAYQAEFMSKLWKPLWFFSLFTGFWILWGTQLSVTDGLVRTVTDVLWSTTKKPHNWKNGQRTIYYLSLLIFSAWGCVAINLAAPMTLLMIGANMAGFIFVVSCLHLIVVNNKFLPKPLRPPMWRNVALVFMFLFYLFFTVALVGKQTGWWSI
jgi:hypothetical protein